MIYVGELHVTLRSADFEEDNVITSLDSYVKLKCGATEHTSHVAKDQGKHPQWNQHFTFYINGEQTLSVDVYDKGVITDSTIGSNTISLAQVFQQNTVDQFYVLQNSSGKEKGKIYLSLAFTAKAVA